MRKRFILFGYLFHCDLLLATNDTHIHALRVLTVNSAVQMFSGVYIHSGGRLKLSFENLKNYMC